MYIRLQKISRDRNRGLSAVGSVNGEVVWLLARREGEQRKEEEMVYQS